MSLFEISFKTYSTSIFFMKTCLYYVFMFHISLHRTSMQTKCNEVIKIILFWLIYPNYSKYRKIKFEHFFPIDLEDSIIFPVVDQKSIFQSLHILYHLKEEKFFFSIMHRIYEFDSSEIKYRPINKNIEMILKRHFFKYQC